MNAYPEDYLSHNLPLILLSGLEDETQNAPGDLDKSRNFLGDGGFHIRAEIPSVRSRFAHDLLAALLECDCSDRPWHAPKPDSPDARYAFRIRSVGRRFTFPPRKAPPPAHSPRLTPSRDVASPAPLTLHSPLSPLSPSSPLYPDGIITPLWVTKHQYRLPSVLVSFYSLTADPNSSSLEDNKIKTEVNSIRTLIASTNYKSKHVLVLVGEDGLDASDLEDRLINIRRGTNFDSKALYYLPSSSSLAELHDFSRVLFQTLYTPSIEYYRDLSKHARRKRNRNTVPLPTVPPPQGAASPLSLQGWNTRYEFKLGVFAEFRQEMEAACRNYEASYEALVSSDLFEVVPTHSHRFNEARRLSDIIAIRIIRCLLWSSQTIAACRWWSKHQARMQDFIGQKGTGVEAYAWEAWQIIWCKTMSDLIQRSAVFMVGNNPDSGVSPVLPVRLHEERPASQTERPLPWESLHHEGYWLRKAAHHIQERRKRALKIPDEQRQPPEHGDSAQRATQKHLAGPYLAPEPWEENPSDGVSAYDHTADYRDTLEAAITAFRRREQQNTVDSIRLNQATELLTITGYSEALDYLKSLHQNTHWRVQGWWTLVETLAKAVSTTAAHVADVELQLVAEWEMATMNGTKHDGLPTSSELIKDPDRVCAAAIDLSHHISPVTCTFVFGSEVGHVGEHTSAQLILKSLSTSTIPLLELFEIKVVFDGGIRPIVLIADPQDTADQDFTTRISDLALDDSATSSTTKRLSLGAVAHSIAEAQLELKPGQCRVFNMKLVPKEAGPVSVSSITILFGRDRCQLTTTNIEPSASPAEWWESCRNAPVRRLIGKDRDPTSINILPKPPKVALSIPDLKATYYTNEQISLSIEVSNGEDEPVRVRLSVRLISPRNDSTVIQWEDMQDAAIVSEGEAKEVIQTLPVHTLEEILAGSTVSQSISISGLLDSVDHELEIYVEYGLPSDPETTLRQSLAADLAIVRPFELNTAFHPRIGQEKWPNFFSYDVSDTGMQYMGLKQHFYVLADVASFASETLQIRSVAITPVRIIGDASAVFSEPSLRLPNLERKALVDLPGGIEISPESVNQFAFDLTLQKLALADRQPVSSEFGVSIQWSRPGVEQLNTSLLPIPRFLAPMSEPRVLLESHVSNASAGTYEIVYTLENPSMHFLTFSITMESSEQLAFSGPKTKTLSLVPISRLSFNYNILPFVKKDWVRVPIEVNDSYFGQTLKVLPASDGVRVDKQGHVQIWIDE